MRHYARALAAGTAVIALSAATPAFAQTKIIPVSAPAASSGGVIDSLLQNARYNIRNGRSDLAYEQLDRVLSSSPGNAEAMMLYVVAYAAADQTGRAQGALDALRNAHPGDTDRIAIAQRAIETGGQSGVGAAAVVSTLGGGAGQTLDAARAAAAAGRYDEATDLYRKAIGGAGKEPPPELAQEYYETLAGSNKGIREAREGLGALYESRRDPRTGLAPMPAS